MAGCCSVRQVRARAPFPFLPHPDRCLRTKRLRGCTVKTTAPRRALGITPRSRQSLSCNLADHTRCIRCFYVTQYSRVAFTSRILTLIPHPRPTSPSSPPRVLAPFLLVHPKYPQPPDAISSSLPASSVLRPRSRAGEVGQRQTRCHDITMAELSSRSVPSH